MKYEFDIERKLKHCSEPTYFYNIGDEVKIGFLKDVKVINVLEGGKIYEISYTSIDHNYGRTIVHENQKKFVMWYEIRKPITDRKESFIRNEDIYLQFYNSSINSIINRYNFFGINLNPDYQREFVWDLNDKIDLIDSVFNNIDIGKFVFAKFIKNNDFSYEVIDGKQRIMALIEYFEDRFPYKGKYFSDLSPREQSFFEEKSISIADVETDDKKTILLYFLMLNKSGKAMKKEDLNKVEEMLKEM